MMIPSYQDGSVGPAMRWCTGGSHIIAPGQADVIETADGLWCSFHPVPVSLHDLIRDSDKGVACDACTKGQRRTRAYVCPDCRYANMLLFLHWMYVTGRFDGDTSGVPLTDEEVERFAPYILP